MKNRLFLFLLIIFWNNYAQNIQKIDSLKKVYANTQVQDTLRVNAISSIIEEYVYQNQDSAGYYLDQLFSYSKKNNSTWGYAKAHYNKASVFKSQNKQDSTINEFNKAIYFGKKLNNEIFLAQCHIPLSFVFLELSKKDSAIYHSNRGLQLAKKARDKNLQGDAYVALGLIQHSFQKFDKSLYYLQKADSIYTITKVRGFSLSNALYAIAQIHFSLNNYEQSAYYFNRVITIYKEINYTIGENAVLYRLGAIDLKQNKYKEAISKLTEALEFFNQKKSLRFIGETSIALAEAYSKTHNINKAIVLTKTADSIFNITKDSIGLYNSKISLSKAFFINKNYKTSIHYAQKALQISTKTKNIQGQKDAYKQLAIIAKQQQNFRQANQYLEKYNLLKDSLLNLTNTQNLQQLETQYQTKKKEQEIALLQSKNKLAIQQQKNQRNLLLSAVGISLLGGLFFFFQYRNRQKTNTKLKELDQAKSTFFSNISHEFRTPLTLIRGPIEDQLESNKLSPAQRKNLLAAKNNTARLENLVDQLLALSKLESNKLNLQIQPGNLPTFIKTQTEAFVFAAQEKSIACNIKLEEENQNHWFDRDAWAKIINNLIGNAIKYTPENGNITIIGKTKGDEYIFSVHNSGTNLTTHQQQQIFNRFYQTSSQNTGTGIGLALTQELVRLHKGSITVESTKETGTLFKVIIPVSKKYFTNAEIFTEEPIIVEFSTVKTNENTIELELITPTEAPTLLLVEDNPEIRNYIASIFENNYQILQVADGNEGIKMAIETIPDIIISDIMMPTVSGIDLTQQLKTHELTTHIPIILLTAKAQDRDKLKGISTGADAYITKPFSSIFLKATVDNLLENRRKIQQRFTKEVVLVPTEMEVSSADERFIEKLKKIMDECLTHSYFTVDVFSEKMGVSRMQLHRKLKALTGQSASEFIKTHRLQLATKFLSEKNSSVSQVGYQVGFNDPSYFTKCFKQEFGCSPKEYCHSERS